MDDKDDRHPENPSPRCYKSHNYRCPYPLPIHRCKFAPLVLPLAAAPTCFALLCSTAKASTITASHHAAPSCPLLFSTSHLPAAPMTTFKLAEPPLCHRKNYALLPLWRGCPSHILQCPYALCLNHRQEQQLSDLADLSHPTAASSWPPATPLNQPQPHPAKL